MRKPKPKKSDGSLDSALLRYFVSPEPSYERQLGRIVIRFSLLHFHLETFSWDLIGVTPQTGQVLTKDLPTKHLVEKLRKTGKFKIPEEKLRNEFSGILARVEKAAERRNELLHAVWIVSNSKPPSWLRRRIQPDHSSPPSISEIDDFNDSLVDLMHELMEFKKRYPRKGLLQILLESSQRSDQAAELKIK